MIVNVNIGMLEKSTNKSQKSLDFESLTEAVYYQNLMGGRINKVSGFYSAELEEVDEDTISRIVKEEKSEMFDDTVDCVIQDKNNSEMTYNDNFEVRNGRYYKFRSIEEKETETKCYTLTVGDRKEMTNGFRYIKELVLQRHNFKMYQDYDKLTKNDVKVYSVKTDAFIIDKKMLRKQRN